MGALGFEGKIKIKMHFIDPTVGEKIAGTAAQNGKDIRKLLRTYIRNKNRVKN